MYPEPTNSSTAAPDAVKSVVIAGSAACPSRFSTTIKAAVTEHTAELQITANAYRSTITGGVNGPARDASGSPRSNLRTRMP
jgi:hypothetical protein